MHKELEKQIESVRNLNELENQNEFLQKIKTKGLVYLHSSTQSYIKESET